MVNRYRPREGYRWYEFGPCTAVGKTSGVHCNARPGERCRNVLLSADAPAVYRPTAHEDRPRHSGGWNRQPYAYPLAAEPVECPNPGVTVWHRGVRHACDGAHHATGGREHSAATADGTLLWYRRTKTVRLATGDLVAA